MDCVAQKKYTAQNLLRITSSFNDLMLQTNRLKKDFFYKDRLIFGLDDPVANMSINQSINKVYLFKSYIHDTRYMSIRHVYYA